MKTKISEIQKKLLNNMPYNVWLRPSEEGFKKHKIYERTIDSLRRKKFIITCRIIGGNFEPYNYMIKKIRNL